MHESANIIVISVCAVDVKNVRPVMEQLTEIKVVAFYAIEGEIFSEDIVLRDKDSIGIRECVKRLACIEIFNIHTAGMIPRSVCSCTVIGTLDFKVIFFTALPLYIVQD